MRRSFHFLLTGQRKSDRLRGRLAVEELENRCLLSSAFSSFTYVQNNLVSDVAGMADVTDPNLVNPWGLASSATGPFWVADNGTGVSTVYDTVGNPFPAGSPLIVTIPPPAGSPMGTKSAPTGVIFNGTSDFVVPGTMTGASTFIFATEDGTISGWNGGDGTTAVLAVDNSSPLPLMGAVYKGLALGSNATGNFLYATNFRGGTIEVFDKDFKPATLSGDFTDSMIPAGFAPFGIQNIGGKLYVTYAKQDAMLHDDVPGTGNGYVDVYDTDGNLLTRLIVGGTPTSPLNSPWGIALAPGSFGRFSDDLLVGNFGDGRINAFSPTSGAFLGAIRGVTGLPLTIDGLWSLKFGNGGSGGDFDSLYFTAGINGEMHGLFGSIQNHDDDIVARASQTGQWFVGISNGSSFDTSTWATWSTGTTWIDVETGDFNGDGKADIAARDKNTGTWWVSLARSGFFATTRWGFWDANTNWLDVQVGDFNGDGMQDIIGRNAKTGDWQLALSNGSTFTEVIWATWSTGTSAMPVTWVDVKVGDFNGDGKSDITGRWLQSGQWWTTLGNGSTAASTSLWATWSTAATWVDVNVGDFNGDGKSDLTGRWLQGGQWWTALSSGSSFSSTLWATWSTAATWIDVKVGDFNGDGIDDITGRWLEGGQWWTAISTGSSFVSTKWATWSTGATWVDVQVGDFEGDGKDDITGRWLQGGQWWTAISSGSSFSSSLWAQWSTGVTWADAKSADYNLT